MDTSKQYIAQCDCPEIQDKWQNATLDMLPSFVWEKELQRVGQMIWLPQSLREIIGTKANSILVSVEFDRELNSYDAENNWPDTTIWLPTQGQLQEMVIHKYNMLPFGRHQLMSSDMLKFIATLKPQQLSSMEQLWLCFIMLELHGKQWCNDNWEVIK